MLPKVAIVLINLNQESHTRECILSLQQVTYSAVDIILVDNGSTDGSGGRLHNEFPGIIYRALDRNAGFAGGNNIGMQIALEQNADYIMLLNNDTIVDKGFIEPLVELAEFDRHIAVQCCKIYFYTEPENFWYAGGLFDIDKAIPSHRGMHERDAGQFDRVEDTDFASGCMFFMRSSAVRNVGLLDDSLFIYFEDSDWCVRARKQGYRVVYNPKATILHKVSVTSGLDTYNYVYLTLRNKLIVARRHGRGWRFNVLHFIYFYSRQFVRMAFKRRSIIGVKAVLYAIKDGLTNYTVDGGRGHLDYFLANRR